MSGLPFHLLSCAPAESETIHWDWRRIQVAAASAYCVGNSVSKGRSAGQAARNAEFVFHRQATRSRTTPSVADDRRLLHRAGMSDQCSYRQCFKGDRPDSHAGGFHAELRRLGMRTKTWTARTGKREFSARLRRKEAAAGALAQLREAEGGTDCRPRNRSARQLPSFQRVADCLDPKQKMLRVSR